MDSIFNILFGNFIRENKSYYIIFIILVLISYPVKSIVLPKFYGKLFDILKREDADINKAKRVVFYIILLWILSNVAGSCISYIQCYIVPKYYMYFRTYIFRNILHKYKKEFKTLDPGSIIIRANELPWASKSLMFRILNDIIPLTFSIILTVFYFTKVGLKLGFVTFSAILIIILILYFRMPACQIHAKNTYNEIKTVNDNLNDQITNMFHIYTTSNIDNEIKKSVEYENKLRETDVTSGLCTAKLKVYLLLVSITCYICSFILCFTDLQNGKYGVGEFVANIYILNYYLEFLENISSEMPGLSYQTGVIGDELSYLLEISNNIKEDVPTEHEITKGHIIFKDISFKYKDSGNVFNKFSIELKPTIKTAIIGKSGSGKSTLMKLLMGFYHVTDGEITIDGINIDKFPLNYLRKTISYVNQNTTLFNNTILYNISYGTTATKSEVETMVKELGIWEFFKYVDYDLDKSVGINGSNMSGGQKQVILILRTLLNKKSKVIVMDEPTSALDKTNKQIFLDILKNIKNKTIIIITHDDTLIEFVDKVIYLQN
jgi:ABC-type multidrug transport system fused ATPase/permease subunit